MLELCQGSASRCSGILVRIVGLRTYLAILPGHLLSVVLSCLAHQLCPDEPQCTVSAQGHLVSCVTHHKASDSGSPRTAHEINLSRPLSWASKVSSVWQLIACACQAPLCLSKIVRGGGWIHSRNILSRVISHFPNTNIGHGGGLLQSLESASQR